LFYTHEGVNYLLSYIGNETNLTLPESYNGENYVIFRNAFYANSEVTSITIPDSVTSIYNLAFNSCSGLTSITIPDSVTSIGTDAFYSCSGLTSVVIGDGVTSIDSSAFSFCSNLTYVTIGNGVTYIGSAAFSHCSNLTYITIGKSVTAIDYFAFYSCPNLSTVYYNGTSSDWGKIEINNNYSNSQDLLDATRYYYSETAPTTAGNFWHYIDGVPTIWSTYVEEKELTPGLYDANDTLLVSWENLVSIYGLDLETDYLMGDTSQQIGNIEYILKKHPEFQTATKFVVGDGITRLGNWAFFSCNWMVSLILPDELLAIGEFSISYNDNLTHVSIPDSVTTIESSAFVFCTNLTNLVIPDSVTSIGYCAFYNCKSLTDIYYTGTEEDWAKIEIDNSYGHLLNATIHYSYVPEE
jgi:hypothetical protein